MTKSLKNVKKSLREIAGRALEKEEPDFFNMGYYVTFAGEALPEMPVPELNEFLRKYTDEHFMEEFSSIYLYRQLSRRYLKGEML